MVGVGLVMLAYVLFGGMLATTWVQIIKAILLLFGVTVLTVLVRYSTSRRRVSTRPSRPATDRARSSPAGS